MRLSLALLALALAVTGSVAAIQRSLGPNPSAAAIVASSSSAGAAATAAGEPTPNPSAPSPTPIFGCHDAPVATQGPGDAAPTRLGASGPATATVPATASGAPTTSSAPAGSAQPGAAAVATTGGAAAGGTPAGGTAACNPTPEQAAAAQKLVDDTRAAIARFPTPADAVAAGYVVSWSDNSTYTRVSHYANWSYWNDGLDPSHVEGLLYGYTQHHGTLLIGGFYLADGDQRPDPGGCLMHWHQHDGQGPWMLHVWTVPMPGGPFAENPDPAYIASL
ncbi:MAG: hypothetical protein JO075_12090 [Acidimicrobiia bacterium]|nr:hypothetical protein [Acidimicrobiia bacterium]